MNHFAITRWILETFLLCDALLHAASQNISTAPTTAFFENSTEVPSASNVSASETFTQAASATPDAEYQATSKAPGDATEVFAVTADANSDTPNVSPKPEVETLVALPILGSVRGSRVKTAKGTEAVTFLGVPFAEPPVGHLRFAKPLPKRPWIDSASDPIVCQKYKPACPQNRDWLIETNPFPSDEDCLYLNIYESLRCRNNSVAKCAVIFFIHGGRNDGAAPLLYPPELLIDNFAPRDIILIMPAYRLNAFGFWSTGTSDAAGNYGVQDLMLALQWVKDNIEYFGGNGSSVTIMGHSSGASMVSLLTLLPATAGLFQAAIPLSGSAILDNNVNSKTERYRQAAVNLGCASASEWQSRQFKKIVDCMKTKSVDSMLGVYSEPRPAATNLSRIGEFTAVLIDGPDGLVPANVSVLSQYRRPIPYMIGTAPMELLAPVLDSPEGLKIACTKAAREFNGLFKNVDVVASACFRHFKTRFQANVSRFTWKSLGQLVIDQTRIFVPVYFDVRTMVNAGSQVYLFQLEYNKPGYEFTPNHMSHVQYAMGIKLEHFNWTEEDTKYSNLYLDLLCNFAKYHNPTPRELANVSNVNENVSTWAPVSSAAKYANYFAIDLPFSQIKQGFHLDAVAFWADEAFAVDAAASEARKTDSSQFGSIWQNPWFFAFLFVLGISLTVGVAIVIGRCFKRRKYERLRGLGQNRRSLSQTSTVSELSALGFRDKRSYRSMMQRADVLAKK